MKDTNFQLKKTVLQHWSHKCIKKYFYLINSILFNINTHNALYIAIFFIISFFFGQSNEALFIILIRDFFLFYTENTCYLKLNIFRTL